jgi:hypothetical protein
MTTTSRIRSTALFSASLGLSLLATPASAAQKALYGDVDWIEPAVVDPGVFQRTDQGDFDGDGMHDMVVHRDSRLEVLLAPGLYDQLLIGPDGMAAYGVCPPISTSQRETLLASSGLGLVQFELDPATGQWNGQVLAPTWAGAPLIEVHTMINTVAVLGVMPDGRTVRTLYRVDDQWFEQPMLVSPETIRDLCVFEFDGGGQIEVAVATDSALWVYDSTGELRQSFPVGDAVSVAIGRIRLKYSVRDGVAWLITRTQGVQQLIVLSPTGITPPEHLAYAPLVVDLETGDIDGDGDWDIVFSHTTDHNAMVLMNHSDGWTTSFDKDTPAGLRIIKFGPKGLLAPDNQTRPNLGDVDGDGDADLLLPVQSNGDLFVWRGGLVDESKFDPQVDLTLPEATCSLEALGGGDLSLTLRLQVDLPEGTPATHVELVVWHRKTCQMPTDPLAVQRVLVPIAGTAPQSLTAQVLLPQVPDIVPGTEVRFEGLYFWAQRAVRVENGAVVQRWHPRVFVIETSPSPDNYSWIKTLGGSMLFPIHQTVNGTSLPDLIGCGSELPKLPNFPGGKVPTWM